MSVHYKFKSALEYDTVTFDGLHISVRDLKKSILHQKKIGKNTDFDLQVTNAQTKEVYTDDNALIAKNTSLIIARIPLTAQQKKAWDRSESNQQREGGGDGQDAGMHRLSKTVDLSSLDASEEDKILAMMSQSTQDYSPSNYMKIRGANQMGEVPANYRCYKCHQPGHWIRNCPLGSNLEPIEIKKSTGIPRSFMVPVEGPQVVGAMMTPSGQFAVPAVDHQAYKEGKKERPPFQPEPEEVVTKPEIPEDLVCSVCKDLLTDAVMIPCCGNSFCDECVRTVLIESEEHECPDCQEKDVSPDTLIPNRFLRNAVNNFRNATGYNNNRLRHRLQAVVPPVPEPVAEEFVPAPVEESRPVAEPEQEGRLITTLENRSAGSSMRGRHPHPHDVPHKVVHHHEPPHQMPHHVQGPPGIMHNQGPPPPGLMLRQGPLPPGVMGSQGPPPPGVMMVQGPPPPGVMLGVGPGPPGVMISQVPAPPGVMPGQGPPMLRAPHHLQQFPGQPMVAPGMQGYPPQGPPSVLRRSLEERPGTPTIDERSGLDHLPDTSVPPPAMYRPQPPPQYPPHRSYGPRGPGFEPSHMPYHHDPNAPSQSHYGSDMDGRGGYRGGYRGRGSRGYQGSYRGSHISTHQPNGSKPGTIDDPLAVFERMLKEKDARDRHRKAARRSRSRSRSYSRSRSRTRSYSRSRSRSRTPLLPPLRKRDRSRSFTISRSRSRSYSRSPLPRRAHSPIREREYSAHRPRYRSPLPPRSPTRYPLLPRPYKDTSRDYKDGGRDYKEGRDYKDPGRDYKDVRDYKGAGRDYKDVGRDYADVGREYKDDGRDYKDDYKDSGRDFFEFGEQDYGDGYDQSRGAGPRGRYNNRKDKDYYNNPVAGGPRVFPPEPRFHRIEPLLPVVNPPVQRYDAVTRYDTRRYDAFDVAPPGTGPDLPIPSLIGRHTYGEPDYYSPRADEEKEGERDKDRKEEREKDRKDDRDKDKRDERDKDKRDEREKEKREEREKEKREEREKEKREEREKEKREEREKERKEERLREKREEREREKKEEKEKREEREPSVDAEKKKEEKKSKDKKKRKKEKEEDKKKKKRKKEVKKDGVDKKLKPVKDELAITPVVAVEVKPEPVESLYGDMEDARIDNSVMATYGKTEEISPKPVVLAPVPELSKWELEDELTSPSDKPKPETAESEIVTSEVLKRAENAIFQKAINAIRPNDLPGKKPVQTEPEITRKDETRETRKDETRETRKDETREARKDETREARKDETREARKDETRETRKDETREARKDEGREARKTANSIQITIPVEIPALLDMPLAPPPKLKSKLDRSKFSTANWTKGDNTPSPKRVSAKDRLGARISEPVVQRKVVKSAVEAKSRSRSPHRRVVDYRRYDKIDDRRIYDKGIDDRRFHEKSLEDRRSYEKAVDERRLYDKAVEERRLYDKAVEERRMYDKALDDRRRMDYRRQASRERDRKKEISRRSPEKKRERSVELKEKKKEVRHVKKRSEARKKSASDREAKRDKKKEKKHKKDKKKLKEEDVKKKDPLADRELTANPEKAVEEEVVETKVAETEVEPKLKNPRVTSDRKRSTLDEASFEPDYDLSSEEDEESETAAKKKEITPEKKEKVVKKRSRLVETESSSESSSEESSSDESSDNQAKRKRRRHKPSESTSESSSESEDKRKKKKHHKKSKTKVNKRKKRSKHR